MAHIAHLTDQLAAANSQGSQVVAALQAEKIKSQSAAAAALVNAGRSGVKVPVVPQFKGEVGFGVDNWLRRLVKHFEFYGASAFPNDEYRIRFAQMFLEGSAVDWWDNIPESEKNRINTWELFVESLHSRFRPMQAAMMARSRLSSLKQIGAVSAYCNAFQKELTPIKDMSPADQLFYFRQGLKPLIAQRVLEKMPKTLHEAFDIAVLADAHTSKSTGGSYTTQFYQRNNATPRSTNDMDISNVDSSATVIEDYGEKSSSSYQEEESESSISSASSSGPSSEMMREFNRMKSELKKFQTQAAISALGSSSSSSPSSSSSRTGGNHAGRVPVTKEEFDYCFKNRLCIKCKKTGHVSRDCRGKVQPLNM